MNRRRSQCAFAILSGTVGILGVVAGCIRPLEHLPPACVTRQGPRAPEGAGTTRLGEENFTLLPDEFNATGGARLLHTLGDPASSGLARWPGLIDVAPTAYDLNGDGVDELIVQSNDTTVYVFSATTGRALAALATCYPPGWFIERVLNGVEVAPLRPGEPPSIVVTDHAAYVAAWRFVPLNSTADQFVFEKLWERRTNDCFRDSSMDAKPTLADLDGDGALETLVQTEEQGLYALNADGTLRWRLCWAGGNSAPVVDDLDGDGTMEVIFASDSGFISVITGATGGPLWTFDARDPRYGISPASVSVSPTVAELDGRPPREILFTARHAPTGVALDSSQLHMAIFAIHRNLTTWQGELLWVRQPPWAHPLSYTRLLVQDLDFDQSPDVFGMDWNTVGHMPGNWEPLGPAHLFRLNATGGDVWVREIDSWWSNKDLALGDTDGDGVLDLLVNGARNETDGLWRISPGTGEPLGFLPAGHWKLMRGPTLLDLRHDGSVQVAYPVAPDEPSPARGAILVFELGPASVGVPPA